MSASPAPCDVQVGERSSEPEEAEVELFDRQFLQSLDISLCSTTSFNPPISVEAPGEDLIMRPLAKGDFHKGFLSLLSQLTSVGEISEEQWLQRFNRMLSMQGTYLVIEDTSTGQVVGAATLVVEDKFIHGCGRVGRV